MLLEASKPASNHTDEAQAAANSPTTPPSTQSSEVTCWIVKNKNLATCIERLLGTETLDSTELKRSTKPLCAHIVGTNRNHIPFGLLVELRVFEALVHAAILCYEHVPRIQIEDHGAAIRLFPSSEVILHYTKTEFPMERRAWLDHTFSKAASALDHLRVDISIIRLVKDIVWVLKHQLVSVQAESEDEPHDTNKKNEYLGLANMMIYHSVCTRNTINS
ncbi:hypothetical protein GQ42DRAFT_165077 [Ramicandelaber brevisporus]|nr:hypothetical protein GQ42DRAFT_165077 [Ramicandelaber brevisporus]